MEIANSRSGGWKVISKDKVLTELQKERIMEFKNDRIADLQTGQKEYA